MGKNSQSQPQQCAKSSSSSSSSSRTPTCARCRNHGFTVILRGHKGFCPHKNCPCELCDLVKKRQEVSKRQIKLRRQQRQEEIMGLRVPVSPAIFSQGSHHGMNLDYLRVLFPRKRVDRLYAVLLQCNNDVDAASTKLRQEEQTGEYGQEHMPAIKAIAAPQVLMVNKATQWSADWEENNAVTSITTTTTTTKSNNNTVPAAVPLPITGGPSQQFPTQHSSSVNAGMTTPDPHGSLPPQLPPSPFFPSPSLPPHHHIMVDGMPVAPEEMFRSRAFFSQDAFSTNMLPPPLPLASPATLLPPPPPLPPLQFFPPGFEDRSVASMMAPPPFYPLPDAVATSGLASSTATTVSAPSAAAATVNSTALGMAHLETHRSSCEAGAGDSSSAGPASNDFSSRASLCNCGTNYTPPFCGSKPWLDSVSLPHSASFALRPPPLAHFPPGWEPRALPPPPFLSGVFPPGAPPFHPSPPVPPHPPLPALSCATEGNVFPAGQETERCVGHYEMATVGPDMATVGPEMATVGPDMATVGPEMATVGPNMATVGPDMATVGPEMATVGPNMATVGPNMATVGHNLATVEGMSVEVKDKARKLDGRDTNVLGVCIESDEIIDPIGF